MKKKNILLSICIAMALGSCSDYLDVEKDLKDRMTLDEVFTSRDYTEQWLAGAYRYVSNYNADMGYGGEWPFAFADDIYHPTYKSFAEKSYGESTYQTSYGYCYQSRADGAAKCLFRFTWDVEEIRWRRLVAVYRSKTTVCRVCGACSISFLLNTYCNVL